MSFIFSFFYFCQDFYKKIVNFLRLDSVLCSNLTIRIKSAVVLFCFSVMALTSNIFFNILFVLSGVVMLFEWDRGFNKNLKFIKMNISIFFVINIVIYFLSLFSIFILNSYTISVIILLIGFIISMFTLIYFNHERFILEAIPSIYISGAIISSIYLYEYFTFLLILLFVITISTDTFAYFIGRHFKGLKLASNISPNKTVSGFIGGIIGAFVFSCIYAIVLFILGKIYSISDLHLYGLIAIMISVLAQCGDLFESYCKRLCNIKDFGRLIPGHGGLLDRFDSFIAIVSVFTIIMTLSRIGF